MAMAIAVMSGLPADRGSRLARGESQRTGDGEVGAAPGPATSSA